MSCPARLLRRKTRQRPAPPSFAAPFLPWILPRRAAAPALFFAACFALPPFFPLAAADPSRGAAAPALEPPSSPVPVFDRKNPQARGVVAAFKSYPASEIDQDRLIKKLREYGLEKTEDFPLFKSWVFSWRGWRPGGEAQKICEDLSGMAFLEGCDPDLLAGPATGLIRKKVKKKADRAIERAAGPQTAPKGGVQLDPPKIRFSETGNVKTCNIVPSQLSGRYEYAGLSDYWAQEMIGSDLMKEELKKAPPPKKHLVSVWDTPFKWRHDMGVKNILSGRGRQAALPPLKNNNMTVFNSTYITSSYMRNASHLHGAARKTCRAVERGGGGRR